MTLNRLQGEKSLYLKQHAQNPVHWIPFDEGVFQLAEKSGKLILFSIGYSSCHWCHVMEKQCFEAPDVAKLMNENFICVKIDREERPDLDALYMEAVQVMSGKGGWPLNCFTLPDGRPIYGGTYFPPEHWKKILLSLAEGFSNNKNTFNEYALKLFSYLSETLTNTTKETTPANSIKQAVSVWKDMFDDIYGGINQAPKFPMPDNYLFLLDYGILEKEKQCIEHSIKTTLAICRGGIFDHLAGGCYRYSTDEEWKVPHFEKMLYDNGQLLSLFSSIASYTDVPDVKRALLLTLNFLEREFKTPFGFLAAMDADSDGEEGVYYSWSEEELRNVCDNQFECIADQFNIFPGNEWEKKQFVLTANRFRNESTVDVKEKVKLSDTLRLAMLEHRKKRSHPVIDTKVIASWNALTLTGLCDAFAFHGRMEHITWLADLLIHQVNPKNSPHRINYNGEHFGKAFFDDIAFTAYALLRTYFICGNEKYFTHAYALTEYAIDRFGDAESPLFFLTDKNEYALIRKKEIQDNVTPSSNAVMAQTLCILGDLTGNRNFSDRASAMLNQASGYFKEYLPAYSRWAKLSLMFSQPFYYLIVCGDEAIEESLNAQNIYIPNSIRIHLYKEQQNILMLDGKYMNNVNGVFICTRNSCLQPFNNVNEVFHYLCVEKESED